MNEQETIAAILEDFGKFLTSQGKSYNTIRQYTSHIKTLLITIPLRTLATIDPGLLFERLACNNTPRVTSYCNMAAVKAFQQYIDGVSI